MARLGGLMAAAASGGEAQPNFPKFDKVMMITGEVKQPKRVLPVFGFNGQELWASEVGVKLGLAQDMKDKQGLTEGRPLQARFNMLEKETVHVEGGRYVHTGKRQNMKSPIKVEKRIKQNITMDSDDEDDDKDFNPPGTEFIHNLNHFYVNYLL